MSGLLRVSIPLLARRAITLVPALIVLGIGVNPTWALVVSQVVLSVGIPFAVIPLVWFTSRRGTMGDFANRMPLRLAAIAAVIAIVALNGALIALTATGAV
jgi:manganese transport protein